MEQDNRIHYLLDLLDKATFCVQKGVIIYSNKAAAQRGILVGESIYPLLGQFEKKYRSTKRGTLCCTIQLNGKATDVSITKIDDTDFFSIDDAHDDEKLQVLSLAAQKLRAPLTNMVSLMDSRFFLVAANTSDGAEPVSQIHRAIMQMHRQISNMADAPYFGADTPQFTTIGFKAFFHEIIEKAATHLSTIKTKIAYAEPDDETYGLADEPLLERAIYNLLANAVKFSPAKARIHVRLSIRNGQLTFSVTSKDPLRQLANVGNPFNMYQRSPIVEGSNQGLGLGLALVRAVASIHGGTVLINYAKPDAVKVSMSIPVRVSDQPILKSPRLPVYRYDSGIDQALTEFAEILPAQAYRK